MKALRSFAIVVLCYVLAACAPTLAPVGTIPTEPRLTDTAFITDDGLSLPVRRWVPQDKSQVKAVVLALHGFNDYAKAFDKIPADTLGTGPFLAAQGVAVYAYDQRGFGAAPYAGLWPGTDALTNDFHDFVHVLRQTHPGVPIYGLGESMGGAVVMAAVAQSQTPLVDGIILAAPAVWARATMPIYYRVPLWLGARLLPGFKPSARGLGVQASDNIELLRNNARDPLFIKETRLDAIYGITNLMDEAFASPPKINVPTLYLYGAKDQVIPRKPTLQAVEAFRATTPTLRTAFYQDGWHIVLRDKQAEVVLKDVAAFIANPTAELPSGADQDAIARLKEAAQKKPRKKERAKK